jgi:hypothetical protein
MTFRHKTFIRWNILKKVSISHLSNYYLHPIDICIDSICVLFVRFCTLEWEKIEKKRKKRSSSSIWKLKRLCSVLLKGVWEQNEKTTDTPTGNNSP